MLLLFTYSLYCMTKFARQMIPRKRFLNKKLTLSWSSCICCSQSWRETNRGKQTNRGNRNKQIYYIVYLYEFMWKSRIYFPVIRSFLIRTKFHTRIYHSQNLPIISTNILEFKLLIYFTCGTIFLPRTKQSSQRRK